MYCVVYGGTLYSSMLSVLMKLPFLSVSAMEDADLNKNNKYKFGVVTLLLNQTGYKAYTSRRVLLMRYSRGYAQE